MRTQVYAVLRENEIIQKFDLLEDARKYIDDCIDECDEIGNIRETTPYGYIDAAGRKITLTKIELVYRRSNQ